MVGPVATSVTPPLSGNLFASARIGNRGIISFLGSGFHEPIAAAPSPPSRTCACREEQSYSGCTGPGFALHSEITAPYINRYGSEEQKQRILPKLVSGEWIGALGMTEPSAGSDFANIKTVSGRHCAALVGY
jgi:alkylation response protein AidB-like acyl-CoA dehydrogenase